MFNTDDAGAGSLRQAILDANANPGADIIAFSIPGSGVHTIQPLSALPDITDTAGVWIDGYSQPGASPNTLAVGDNAVLAIELDGSQSGTGAFGLSLAGGNSTVEGLVINQFGANGIQILGNGGNTVRGNFIGTAADGVTAKGNASNGIDVSGSSNTIGGTTAGAQRHQRQFCGGNPARRQRPAERHGEQRHSGELHRDRRDRDGRPRQPERRDRYGFRG